MKKLWQRKASEQIRRNQQEQAELELRIKRTMQHNSLRRTIFYIAHNSVRTKDKSYQIPSTPFPFAAMHESFYGIDRGVHERTVVGWMSSRQGSILRQSKDTQRSRGDSRQTTMSYKNLWARRNNAPRVIKQDGAPYAFIPCPKGCLRVTAWIIDTGRTMMFPQNSGRALCSLPPGTEKRIVTVAPEFHLIFDELPDPEACTVTCGDCTVIIQCTESLRGKFRLA